ncbi:MAG: hypothetical protein KDE34_11100 [Anaerolineales bacterium]|nr:hypothetical protein [Anaerolineales bacterium]
MLEKPALADERIRACLETAYGLQVTEISFLPLGADVNTAVYRVVATDGTNYFLKLRQGPFDEMAVRLPHFLSEQGVKAVIPPLPTLTGRLWAELPPFRAILAPFVNGRNGYETRLNAAQWQAFARALRLNEEAGNMLAALNAARGWGQLLLTQGDLAGAEARFRAGLALVADQPRTLLAAPLQVSLGQLCLETGRLAEAESLLVAASKLLALSGPVNQSEGLVALARLRLAQGQPAAVEPLLTELQALQRQAPGGYARQQLDQALASTETALLEQQPDPGWRALLANQLALGVADPLSAARGWLALDQPARALTLLAPLTTATAQQAAAGSWLVAALLRAQAHVALDDEAEALHWLEQSLKVGGPAGYHQLFLELGRPLHPQLTLLSRQNDLTGDFARQLLSHLPAPVAESQAAPIPVHPAAEQLSPREIEVLQLIAQGLSNKAIAARLVIAPSTAKRHTSNIYLKLDVTNRAEAAARAYELGLV